MDGWMGVCVDAWKDGWVDAWVDGRIVRDMGGCFNGWIDG